MTLSVKVSEKGEVLFIEKVRVGYVEEVWLPEILHFSV